MAIQQSLTPSTWNKLQLLESEFERRGEQLTRTLIAEAFNISDPMSRCWRWALTNKEVIRAKPLQLLIAEAERVLVLNDIHIPYHDPIAVEAALAYGERLNPTIVLLNGDVIDFYQISRYIKRPTHHNVETEIQQTRTFLEDLRLRFPDARILYKQGNHEQRLEHYIITSAREIYTLIGDLLANKLDFARLGIEYHEDIFQLGKLWILHGHEKPNGGDPEYVTNVIFKYVLDHFIVGHFHRTQEKIFRRINGDTFWGGALGYLAGPMDYAPLNKWNQGVGALVFKTDGSFKATLKTIQDGEIY